MVDDYELIQYDMLEGAQYSKVLFEKQCISEASTELPNPVDVSGKESYLYFWANDAQANERGSIRNNNKVIFFKATDDYLSRLN